MSLFFLRVRLQAYRWAGMGVVVVGLAIVGVADILLTKADAKTSTQDIIIGFNFTFFFPWLFFINKTEANFFFSGAKSSGKQICWSETAKKILDKNFQRTVDRRFWSGAVGYVQW